MSGYRSPRHARQPGESPHGARRLLVAAAASSAAVLAAGIGLPLVSQASTASSAAFSGGAGTVSVGGTLYAKNGGALTLTVTTSSDTECVDVTGAFAGHQTSPTAKSSWTFSFTAGTGDGVQTVTAAASPKFNANNCTGQSQSPQSASFVLDNTGPLVAAAVSPAPNAAGWNNSNVAITWSATDAGSGVGSGPTPATDSQTANTSSVTKTATATDRLGNVGNGLVTVKLDKAAPTITGSRSPAANANGWNNSDVTVSFVCSDPPAGSGIKSCTAPTTLSASAADQSVTGTAVDNADNSSSATAGGINIDKVPPTLSGAPTTTPNADGWYSGDVTVHWTASDGLSGLAGSIPPDSTITGEGQGLHAGAAVSDKAGNTTTATSGPGVNIDRTPPTTTADVPSGWTNTDVTIGLTPSDALSGVHATYYTVDGGPQQTGTSIPLGSEGIHQLTFWSVDKAGNTEKANNATVKIDKTAPTIKHVQDPAANSNGWNNTDVTVTFTCDDGDGSGIASCTTPQTVTTEGTGQPVTGTATDNAGNPATDVATVNIDKSAPMISGAADRKANDNGWYDADVTVAFTCGDALSGMATCTAPKTIGEGANQSVTGTATDVAGNTAHATVSGINVDETAPILTGKPTTDPVPGSGGWYSGDVTVHWTCSDQLSGIDGSCPADGTTSGEGAGVTVSATVSDLAGNSTSTPVSVNVDKTAPDTTPDVSGPQVNGWYTKPPTVTLAAIDPLSGVAHTAYAIDGGPYQDYTGPFAFTPGGAHSLTWYSADKAGNVENQRGPLEIDVDDVPPTIDVQRTPAPNANGWNNSAVTVSFHCEDHESGIASENGCSGPTTFTQEGKGQTVTGTATDAAGNTAGVTVDDVDIDLTAPTFATVSYADKTSYTLGAVPAPGCTATDALSGVDTCTVDTTWSADKGVGSYSFTATATDKAGNRATSTGTFCVVYRFDGFLQPINDTAHQVGTSTSIFKAGSTVPVKVQMKRADGTVVQGGAPQFIGPVKGSATSAAVNETAYTDSPTAGSAFTWDPVAQQWVYTWSTKGLSAGYYYRIGAVLDDGSRVYVSIGLR
ncbi:MAG TPA: PxKF domain-containing protein [Kineosporiaceae bacterium]|nr:PxKF domain-containing protein [Kineosporiaceae bacterium]